MRLTRILLILALAAVVAPGIALADCGGCSHSKSAETAAKAHSCGKDCSSCSGPAKNAVKLAEGAELGCSASMNALIAMAKDSGDTKAVALAEKAEGGCEHSKADLIALAKTWKEKTAADPTMALLAKNAAGGCAASTTRLIQMAKTSDDAKMADLAARAEGGCEHSKAELIAMAQAPTN